MWATWHMIGNDKSACRKFHRTGPEKRAYSQLVEPSHSSANQKCEAMKMKVVSSTFHRLWVPNPKTADQSIETQSSTDGRSVRRRLCHFDISEIFNNLPRLRFCGVSENVP